MAIGKSWNAARSRVRARGKWFAAVLSKRSAKAAILVAVLVVCLGGMALWILIEFMWALEIETRASFFGAVIGAGITVVAAFAVTFIQINVQRGETAENIERQRQASRAILGLDLSHLCTYAKKCAEVAMGVVRSSERSRNGRMTDPLPCPELNPDITQHLKRLVELLDSDDADQVIALLHCFQVQYARLSGELEGGNPSGSFDFEHVIVGTVELHLRAVSMFAFARRESPHISPPPYADHEVANTLRVLNIANCTSEEFAASLTDQMGKLDPIGRWKAADSD